MKNALILSVILLWRGSALAQAAPRTHLSQSYLFEGNSTTQAEFDTSANACNELFADGVSFGNNALWEESYDSLTLFIERCTTSLEADRVFNYLDVDVQNYPLGDTSRYTRYLYWLESVLYLNNTDPHYWCACAVDISDRVPGGINGTLTTLKWLIGNSDCDNQSLKDRYSEIRKAQREAWSQGDTTIPLDTTLPSMHDIGLDSLFGLHLLQSVPHVTLFTSILQAFALSENPFQSNALLRFNLNSMAYVRTEVYDELGRTVLGDGSGKVYESGLHQLPIDLSKVASGVYYLRISLADGEARTLKMRKQE